MHIRAMAGRGKKICKKGGVTKEIIYDRDDHGFRKIINNARFQEDQRKTRLKIVWA